MSDMKKWIKLIESSENRIVDSPKDTRQVKRDATVTVSPKVGGGVGRFAGYEGGSGYANIDIKGIMRKLSAEDFSTPARDYEDPYVKGNDWFHVSQEPDTIGTQRDKPEFRPGDMVKIADVYGAVIGPGYGIFVAYGTTGQDCIISFDNKQIVVPTSNIAAVLEQDAKDNFDEMDNDGNLSPMSLGSKNVKIEGSGMEQKDEFSKWMSTVEEALASEDKEELEENIWSEEVANECGCAKWDCPTCFPDQDVHPGEHTPPQTGGAGGPPEVIVIGADPTAGLGAPAVCPHCGFPHDEQEGHGYDEEVPMVGGLEEISNNTLASYIPKAARSASDLASRGAFELGSTDVDHPDWSEAGEADDRKAAKRLGNVDKAVGKLVARMSKVDEKPDPGPYGKRDGQNSPMSYGNKNQLQLAQEDQFADTGNPEWTEKEEGENSPLTYGEDNLRIQEAERGQEPGFMGGAFREDDSIEFISSILYIQDMGLSNADRHYTEEELKRLAKFSPDKLRELEAQVTGGVDMDEEEQKEEMLIPPDQANPMGGGGGATGGGGKYPSIPESKQKGNSIMENIDKDVAAMLKALNKYDKLVESRAPVLGLKTLVMKEAKPDFPDIDKDGDEKETIKKAAEDKKKKEKVDESEDEKEEWVPPWKKDKEGKKDDNKEEDDKKDDVKEGADPDVLAWMGRFAKLGNMKGYGR